jgi:hypothetical protein
MLHLTNDIPLTHALCGKPIAECPENTDALLEVISDPSPHAGSVCEQCWKAAEIIVLQEERPDQDWKREIAREEGMLNGVASFNDWNL